MARIRHIWLNLFLVCVGVQVSSTADPSCSPVSLSVTVPDTAAVDTTILSLNCNDPDAGDVLVYDISSGNDDGFFKVANGVLQVAQPITPKITYRHMLTIVVGQTSTGETSVMVTVDVIYTNAYSPAIVVNPTIISVSEDQPIGTLLAVATISDQDSPDKLAGQARFKLNKPFGAAARKWVVDGVSGEIYVNTLLDYETTKSYNMTLEAYDLDAHNPRTTTIVVVVNVLDANDNIPACTEYLSVVPIISSKPVSEEIINLNCSDIDSGDNGLITYQLDALNSGTINDLFDISSTGSLSLKSAITSTTIPFYEVLINVKDSGISSSSSKVLVRVVVTDVPQDGTQPPSSFTTGNIYPAIPPRATPVDTSTRTRIPAPTSSPGVPYCPRYGLNLVLGELTAIATMVYDIDCTDPDGDQLTYNLTKGDTYDKFTAVDGKLTTVKALNGDFTFKYSLTVIVTDDSPSQLSTMVSIAVYITNNNDNSPVIKDVPDVIEVNEDAPFGTTINMCSVNDKDSKNGELPGQTRVGIQNPTGAIEKLFLLDPVTCKLYVNTELDFETTQSYEFILLAWDLDTTSPNTVSTTVNIMIKDVNDNAPACPSSYSATLAEDASISSAVADITCTDADTGDNKKVYFLIDETNTAAVQSAFTVNPTSGQVSLLGLLDYEGATSHDVKIKAYDGGIPSLSSTSTIAVTVTDVADGSVAQNTSTPPYKIKPTVQVTTEDISEGVAGYKFICDFSLDTTPLYYVVDWYIDGRLLHTTLRETGSSSGIQQSTALTESTLVTSLGVDKVGIDISCAFRASYGPNTVLSRDPIISDEQFIGIKVLTKSITLKQGEEGVIQIQATAPIGCFGGNGCVYSIYSYLQQGSYDCSLAVAGGDSCGTSIPVSSWNGVYEVKIKAGITYQYGTKASTSILKLRGSTYSVHPLWSNYILDDVAVTIVQDTALIEGSKCSAFVDPRIVTFDRTLLDLQELGIYTLYKRGDQEIQIKTYKCDNDRSAWCVCGVVIRAGRDVYIMNKCGLEFHDLRYTLCADVNGAVLKVEKYETLYQAYMPTGTRVKVFMRPDNMNVFIYPSVMDIGTSRGLCGNLSGDYLDDLILKNGVKSSDPPKKSTYETAPNFFASWKVAAADNLFDEANLGGLVSLTSGDFGFNKDDYQCVASGSPLPGGTGAISSGTCNIFIDVNGIVFKENYTPVTRDTASCASSGSGRRKRSVTVFTVEENMEPLILSRRKRAELWKNGWTEEKALKYCDELFNSSAMVSLCKDISLVDVTSSKIACFRDIKLTGSEKFSLDAMSSVRSQCVHEVNSNTDFHKPSTPGATPLIVTITAVTCPGECTGQGVCVAGECQCYKPFGGKDCSVNITSEPLLVTLDNNGLCDISQDDCTAVTAFGETFVESTTTSCLLRYFERTEGQSMSEIQPTTSDSIRPYIESISEAKCQSKGGIASRTELNVKEFVTGYIVSLTNDGQTFSNPTHMTIYNSECQSCANTANGVECSYHTAACISGGKCYTDGEVYMHDSCYSCKANVTHRDWVFDGYSCKANVTHRDWVFDGKCNKQSMVWVAGVVIGLLALVPIIIAIVYYIKRKNKISNSRAQLIPGKEGTFNYARPASSKSALS